MPKAWDKRHVISYELIPSEGITWVRAVCQCNEFQSPAFFDRLKAEEAGIDHMRRHGGTENRGRPKK